MKNQFRVVEYDATDVPLDAPVQPILPIETPATKTGAHHPATSFEAARRAIGRSGTTRRRIYDYLMSNGPATDEEISAILGIVPNTARPRRIELVQWGWAYDTGLRKDTTTGSRAILWGAQP